MTAEQTLVPQLKCTASTPIVFRLGGLGLHSGKQIGQRPLLYRLGGLCLFHLGRFDLESPD